MVLLALLAVAVAGLLVAQIVPWPEGGRYPRYEHDHDALMVSDTPRATKAVTVVFVGNSLTFHNDLPAMLANVASSDPGNTTRLQVKGETFPNGVLDEVRSKTGALDWIRSHHVDYVVLQDHGQWYDDPAYDGVGAVDAWNRAMWAQGVTPLLFETWADDAKSEVYTDSGYRTFGSNPAQDTARSANATEGVARTLGLHAVPVGDVFEAAYETRGAPDVLGPDHHHPSVAGTYLAALVFYRYFTGRTGEAVTYRPAGLSAQGAAALKRINAG
jgi:hypothetical protein